MKYLELLAPAKDYEHGCAAIDYGADAVYIACEKFGARSAAGNSMEDIERLAEYAHLFGAKVYLAINTILYDDELAEAERIASTAWKCGVDALIVQDMSFLKMSLPPIPLHASTQTFSDTPEKCAFLESVGFSRIIMERGLSLEQIKNIRANTNIELEAFIHGAICVCYSGQCYMSQAISGRSGNRGECMQPCRWDFSLLDSNKKAISGRKHYLSVMDFNLTDHLESLIDTGVTSFKIEGRLKDMTYLKNSVGHYRKRLDEIIFRRNDLMRSSNGITVFDFEPNPEKSFSRGFSDYFFINKQNKVASFNTPKSVGQYIGKVKSISKNSFVIESGHTLTNGDGICFVSGGVASGTNINRVEGDTIYPNRIDGITVNTKIYKNFDHKFDRELDKSKTVRKIVINITINIANDSVTAILKDSCGNVAIEQTTEKFEIATNSEKAKQTIVQQFSKMGNTIFTVGSVDIVAEEMKFIPSSVLNELRRKATETLSEAIKKSYKRQQRSQLEINAQKYPTKILTYKGNVVNSLAEKFYKDHGVEQIESGFELGGDSEGREVMRTSYCIRRELGRCLKELTEKECPTLFLENDKNLFELDFDCKNCEMKVIYRDKK